MAPKPHGLFGWVDLPTTDPDAAKAFYGSLFGWVPTDIETPVGPVYSMMRKDDLLVAGIGPQPPDLAAAGLPPMWTSYVIVDDADAVCARAASSGGFVAMQPMEVMTQGRLAMVGAPSGAMVGVWQSRDHDGAELFNAPGSLTWNELQSRSLETDLDFYATVFGWRWEPNPGSPDYLVGQVDAKDGDDKTNCGAMQMPPSVPADVPSFWMVYFAVDDCDESFQQAQELGATAVFAPMTMGPGTFAGLTDPTGAMFCVGAFQDPG